MLVAWLRFDDVVTVRMLAHFEEFEAPFHVSRSWMVFSLCAPWSSTNTLLNASPSMRSNTEMWVHCGKGGNS